MLYNYINDSIYTDKTLTLRKCMYMRASGASELRKFGHFHILILLFPSIFLLVLHILCLRNIFNCRCQITSAYIYQSMQFPFITYGMVLYKRQHTDQATNTYIEQMYVYASELRKFGIFTFLNLYSFNILSVHQILCRYKWHACRLTCSDKFPNVPTNCQMYRQNSEKALWGGGDSCHPPPPPPLWLR